MSRLESWNRQFCDIEEQYFSACLLDQLIFRTTQQFEAGLRSLFHSNLNGALFANSEDLQLFKQISSRRDPSLRLVPVICETDPPTKSGPLVLRRLQRTLQLNQKWMCWPWQAAELAKQKIIKTIIFVDDFLGSGTQFTKFFQQWNFPEQDTQISYIYSPVVAHEKGIAHLGEKLPNLRVVSAEMLGDSHSFFSDTVWDRLGQGYITARDAKDWYINFVTTKKIIPNNTGALGYGDLALTFGFSHSSPNNSLPILWYETDDWQPLLER